LLRRVAHSVRWLQPPVPTDTNGAERESVPHTCEPRLPVVDECPRRRTESAHYAGFHALSIANRGRTIGFRVRANDIRVGARAFPVFAAGFGVDAVDMRVWAVDNRDIGVAFRDCVCDMAVSARGNGIGDDDIVGGANDIPVGAADIQGGAGDIGVGAADNRVGAADIRPDRRGIPWFAASNREAGRGISRSLGLLN
jgi:hypothetical protein